MKIFDSFALMNIVLMNEVDIKEEYVTLLSTNLSNKSRHNIYLQFRLLNKY
jgi:hypothetical protein